MFLDDTEKKWIAGLKVGDEVYISQRFGDAPRLAHVKRLTPSMIIVQYPSADYEMRFRRRDGDSVGGTIWYRQSLIMPSDNVREQGEIARLKAIANKLREKLSTPQDKETLIKFIACLREFVKEEKIVPKEG